MGCRGELLCPSQRKPKAAAYIGRRVHGHLGIAAQIIRSSLGGPPSNVQHPAKLGNREWCPSRKMELQVLRSQAEGHRENYERHPTPSVHNGMVQLHAVFL